MDWSRESAGRALKQTYSFFHGQDDLVVDAAASRHLREMQERQEAPRRRRAEDEQAARDGCEGDDLAERMGEAWEAISSSTSVVDAWTGLESRGER